MASQLASSTTRLEAQVDAWKKAGGDRSWPPPVSLERSALTQQRIYAELSQRPLLKARVLRLLSPALRRAAAANIGAEEDLVSLVPPSGHRVTFRTRAPLPAATLKKYYMTAERRFGVSWPILAAINFVESRFGRVVSPSSAGAQGPMQFIPSTWGAYGLGGNVHAPADAIMGAANYLRASGAPADYAGALYHYNPARAYVRAILLYAERMRLDPRAFYEYYNWQVFVLTPSGFKQLTGPRN
jgi:soluble lytic murein transglycosylase-like protein